MTWNEFEAACKLMGRQQALYYLAGQKKYRSYAYEPWFAAWAFMGDVGSGVVRNVLIHDGIISPAPLPADAATPPMIGEVPETLRS